MRGGQIGLEGRDRKIAQLLARQDRVALRPRRKANANVLAAKGLQGLVYGDASTRRVAWRRLGCWGPRLFPLRVTSGWPHLGRSRDAAGRHSRSGGMLLKAGRRTESCREKSAGAQPPSRS